MLKTVPPRAPRTSVSRSGDQRTAESSARVVSSLARGSSSRGKVQGLPNVSKRPSSTQPEKIEVARVSPHPRPATVDINRSRGRAHALTRAGMHFRRNASRAPSSSSSDMDMHDNNVDDNEQGLGFRRGKLWELQTRARSNLKPSSIVGVRNNEVESMQKKVNRKTRAMVLGLESCADTALEELSVGIDTLDAGIRSVRDSVKLFGTILLDSDLVIANSNAPRPTALEDDDMYMRDEQHHALKDHSDEANALLKEFQEHVVVGDTKTSVRRNMNLSSGTMLRAWAALDKCPHGTNVHDLDEVQAIKNGCDRVDTKLGYFRENVYMAAPLLQQVEDEYMHLDVQYNTNLLDLGRLRNLQLSPSGKSSRALTPPPLKAGAGNRSLQEKASQHSVRIGKAIAQSKELEMGWRVTCMQNLNRKMARADKAARTRPWFVAVCVAMATVTIRRVLDVISCELVETVDNQRSDCKESSSKKVSPNKEAQRRLNKVGDTSDSVLSNRQMKIIHRMVMHRRLQTMQIGQRSTTLKLWMHLLRAANFIVKLKRPLKRHRMMDVLKEFVQQSWRGMRIRSSVRKYSTQMRFLQIMLRRSYDLMNVVKKQVILPQVWAMESFVLGVAAGIKEDIIRQEVAEFLQSRELDRWKHKAQEMIASRHNVLKSRQLIGMRRIDGCMDDGLEELADTIRSSSGLKMLGLERSVSSTGTRTPPVSSREPSKLSNSPAPSLPSSASKMDRLHDNLLSPTGSMKIRRQAIDRRTSDMNRSSILINVESLRLTKKQLEAISSIVYRENLERWWQQYKSYKAIAAFVAPGQDRWKREIDALGSENKHLWPDPPELPKYPEELMKINQGALRFHVTKSLKQGRAASLFPSESQTTRPTNSAARQPSKSQSRQSSKRK